MAAQAETPPTPEISPRMFIVPAFMLGIRFLKIEFTEYVVILRIAYVVAMLTSISVYAYLIRLAKANTDDTKVQVIEKVPTSGAEARRTLTVGEYDAEEAFKKIKSLGFGMCVVAFIHLKWGSPMPLLLQSVMTPVNLSDDPLVKIHFFKAPATGKLKRPFKVSNPFQQLMEGGGNAPAAVPAAPPAAKKSE
uniref:Inorganic phosphate transporter n=1 Tax=Aureoumbra lagunensis TaxID=44058 RepID=A0A7S3JS43_9STRA